LSAIFISGVTASDVNIIAIEKVNPDNIGLAELHLAIHTESA